MMRALYATTALIAACSAAPLAHVRTGHVHIAHSIAINQRVRAALDLPTLDENALLSIALDRASSRTQNRSL